MSRLDYECANNHIFESNSGRDRERCPTCGSRADIIWLSPSSPHRQLQTPVVFWRYSDGTMGIAASANSRTPKDAERVEARSFGDYRRHTKELNNQLRSKEMRREESFLKQKEQIEKAHRSQLSHMMANESDPAARDIYREALDRGNKSGRPLSFGEFFSMAMEMDKNNHE